MIIAGIKFTRDGSDVWTNPEGWRLMLDLTNVKYPWRVGRPGAEIGNSRYMTPYIAINRAKEKYEHAKSVGADG